MSRFRATLISAGLVAALAALAFDVSAQPPGGPPGGRGQRGNRGGPGGPGPWGGPGGPQTGIIGLAQNEAVQKELKVTDRQKALLQRLTDEQNTKRREAFQKLNEQANAARAQIAQQAQAQAMNPQVDPSLDARGSGAGNPLLGALNNRGYVPPSYGGQVLNDPFAAQQQAQLQAQMANNALRAESRQMMRMAALELQQQAQREVAKILDRNQMKRLREIELQMDAPFTVLDPQVAERIELGEDQAAEIQQFQAQAGMAKRQASDKTRELMGNFFRSLPAANQNPPGGTPGNPGPGVGNPRGGPPQIDPQALKKYAERPEVKAQLEQIVKEHQLVRNESFAQVSKILDRRQMSSYRKLLGAPSPIVDALQLGPLGGVLASAEPKPKNDAAKADASKGAAKGQAPASKDATATSKAAAPARKPSLRERRGLGGQNSDSSPN